MLICLKVVQALNLKDFLMMISMFLKCSDYMDNLLFINILKKNEFINLYQLTVF